MAQKFEAGQPVKVYRYKNTYGDKQEVWDNAIVIETDIKSKATGYFGRSEAKGGYIKVASISCYSPRFIWHDDEAAEEVTAWQAWPFEINAQLSPKRNATNSILPVKTWEETVGAANLRLVAARKAQELKAKDSFEQGLNYITAAILAVGPNPHDVRALVKKFGDGSKIRDAGS